ncbi:hypothetical protein [Williamsia sp.]|uniref:hypothetical protein n=1 Tax=Williamsia sp. TaxID=1872085 RepID=UPI001A284E97|nr:hypothetical protein [Williamsia sp.]MBJ7287985.1 hypothetical protein [Williamsia sp.]
MLKDEVPAIADELLGIINQLCKQCASYTRDDKPDMVLVSHHRGDAVSIAVHALANETTQCSGAARSLLLREYPPIFIMPLVRQALECACTAQWLVEAS